MEVGDNRSKKHKEKLAVLREALQEDAELGGDDLLSDWPAESEPEPAPSSKHRLKKEVESRTASSRPAQPPDSQEPLSSPASRDRESLAASEASEEDLSEDAMLARLIEAQQGGAGPRQQHDDEEELDAWETVPHPETSSVDGDAELAANFEGVHLAPDEPLHHNGSAATPTEDHQSEAEDNRTGMLCFCFLTVFGHVGSPSAEFPWCNHVLPSTSYHPVL